MSLYDLGRCWGDFFGWQVEIAHNRTLVLFSFKRWLCAGIVGTEDTGIPEHLLNPQSKLHWKHVLSANPMSKILAGLDSLVSFEYLFFLGGGSVKMFGLHFKYMLPFLIGICGQCKASLSRSVF